MTQQPLTPETELVAALRLTAAPPPAWVDAAAMIPSTLGDLDQLERLAADPSFRARFAADPAQAVERAGLTPSTPVLAALRERLGTA
jgi:hypothetical protein